LEQQRLYKLTEIPAGTVLEVNGEKTIDTVNGEALLVEFSSEIKDQRVQGKLIIPNRMREDVVGKVPIILLYHGKNLGKNGKEFHHLTAVEINGADPSTPCKAPRKKFFKFAPFEAAKASFSDDESDEGQTA